MLFDGSDRMTRSRSTITGIDRARRGLALALTLCGILGLAATGRAAQTEPAATSGPGSALMLNVDGAIGPATTAYIRGGIERAEESNASLLILRMDTPGGLTASTRDIVKAIRSARVPVATWVAPAGARAASAGTYILYASHVAAMAPATNVGAATPVAIGGGSPAPRDRQPQESPGQGEGQGGDQGGGEGEGQGGNGQGEEQPDDAEGGQPAGASNPGERKALNDAAAWIRGLAQETGRNAEWAEKAVRQAASLTAGEAVEMNVADFLAADVKTLLQKADGRTVRLAGEEYTVQAAGAEVERLDPDWRSELLAIITNPTVAYLLMMVGIYGLLLEGYNPGALLPGTVGAISLLLALYAFQVLPVNFAGLLLIALGIILIVSEALMPSFGVLGFGGIVALVVGSIILMDMDTPGFEIAIEVIASVATVSGLIMLGLAYMAVKSLRSPVVSGSEEILGASGVVIEPVDAESGWVHMLGERWQARSDDYIPAGQTVRVVERDGLVVRVRPVPPEQTNGGDAAGAATPRE